jgi:NAD(P)-dependent dehydrogenase (short-subunit alcohol dehydrogenase family)
MNSLQKHEKSNFSLNGKWALITGGAGLLGIEHARALLTVGANIVLWDINDKRLQEAQELLETEYSEQRISIQVVDITKESEVIASLDMLSRQDIAINVLVNNAAINPKYSEGFQKPSSRVEHFSIEDWNTQLSVGLTGAFICSKNIGERMEKAGGGVIVNIASDLSVISPDQRLYAQDGLKADQQPVKPVTYSVIKSGLVGLTMYLATYWRSSNIRVNALSPGGVYENQDPAFVEKLTSLIPLGRMAQRDEYHGAIQFLCSDASSYMTGQNLIVDGGRTIW